MRSPVQPALCTFAALAFGLASLTLAAQSPASGASLVQLPSSENCPVALSARRLPLGGAVATRTSAPSPSPALHLVFVPQDGHSLVAADVILHGIAGHHVLPAGDSGAAQPGDTTEQLDVTPHAGAANRFTSILQAKKLTGVQFLELRSLTFADGTRWHSSAHSACRVAPDGYQLVAAR